MARLHNPIITRTLRDDINRSVKGVKLSDEETRFFAARFGVSPKTVRDWFSPRSSAAMLPSLLIGRSALGSAATPLEKQWRERALLGLALMGDISSRSSVWGARATYNDAVRGSLIDVFRRLSSYTQYGIDAWTNEAWRGLRLKQSSSGAWKLEVEYDRIPSDFYTRIDDLEEEEEDWSVGDD